MRRYHIKIYLSDHNVIDAKAEADSLEDAVDKIATTATDWSNRPKTPQRIASITAETFGTDYPEPEKM